MLKKVLEAREARWNERLRLVGEYGLPLLTFTLTIPGPEKTGDIFIQVHRKILGELKGYFNNRKISLIHLVERKGFDGPEAFMILDTSAEELKRMVLAFEEEHPIGRVLDLDVMDRDGKCLSREAAGLPPRKCILCNSPARECIVLRRHDTDEVLSRIREMVSSYLHQVSG
jgi:holo-ACP synthase